MVVGTFLPVSRGPFSVIDNSLFSVPKLHILHGGKEKGKTKHKKRNIGRERAEPCVLLAQPFVQAHPTSRPVHLLLNGFDSIVSMGLSRESERERGRETTTNRHIAHKARARQRQITDDTHYRRAEATPSPHNRRPIPHSDLPLSSILRATLRGRREQRKTAQKK